MLAQNLAVPSEAIADFCRRHHIRKLSFFGSVLGDRFNEASDVDVLVEFEEGKTPGYAFITMQDELAELLGKEVDLHTPQSLSKYFRDKVLAEAETLYDRSYVLIGSTFQKLREDTGGYH